MTNLEKCWRESGMTQQEIAAYCGVKAPSVCNWINGRNYPSKENLQRLSELFHVSLEYLVGIEDEKKLNSNTVLSEDTQEILRLYINASPEDRAKIIGFATGLSAKK